MRLFLKLGGSLITDKAQPETVRGAVLTRVAGEIATARLQDNAHTIVLGHGSGSFGHVAAAKFGTRTGVTTREAWAGFAAVAVAASRLNHIVRDACWHAGIPVLSLSPSASVQCKDGVIIRIASEPVLDALAAGLMPLVHGDVAFDQVRGGTIVSTEEVFASLMPDLTPDWLLLAGETDGVYDEHGAVIREISAENIDHYRSALGGSRGTDVTGGMIAKVEQMLALVAVYPNLSVRIFSGLEASNIANVLSDPTTECGTVIR